MVTGRVLLAQALIVGSAAVQALGVGLVTAELAPLAALDPLASWPGMGARAVMFVAMFGGGGLLVALCEVVGALLLFRRDIWGWTGGILAAGLAIPGGCAPLGIVALGLLVGSEVRARYLDEPPSIPAPKAQAPGTVAGR